MEKIDHPTIVEWSVVIPPRSDIGCFCRPPRSDIGTIPRPPCGILFWRIRHPPTTFSNGIALMQFFFHLHYLFLFLFFYKILKTSFQVSYNWMFYAGCGPIFLAFFAVTFLTHWETWDPVLLAFKKLLQCLCRRRIITGPR